MLNKIFLLLFFISFFYSCNNKKTLKEETIITQDKKLDTLQKFVLKINEKLTPKGKILVEDWGEYQRFNTFLEENQIYTPEESLLNANELAKLAQELKDSIRIEKLQTPAVKIRLNVIHNEAMRLEDMSDISIITEEEVKKEYSKIYEAFSALNSKINNNLNQEKLNKEFKDFINEVSTNDSSNKNTVIEEKLSRKKKLNIPK
ncbi:MAG: hypothetical protein ABFR32_00725 [Bacteroidota bacterium]